MRSVNLERDADVAASLSGYIITSRGREAFERIIQSYIEVGHARAWTLTGVYGTGKSAFANLLAAQFAAKESPIRKEALKILRRDEALQVATKLARKIPEDGCVRVLAACRREPLAHTLVRALARGAESFWSSRVGPKPLAVRRLFELRDNVAAGVQIQAPDLPELVGEVAAASRSGVLIILDELGKALEFAALSGGNADLYLLQQLAELPAGSADGPVLLIGLLHQNFGEYSDSLSSAERAEWEKVHGRFEDLPFDESGEQTLRLIADAIDSTLPPGLQKGVKAYATEWAKSMSGTLPKRHVREALSAERIARVFPLHPLAAVALPLLCSRYAQNDRSLFTFLASNGPNGFSSFLEQHTPDERPFPLLRVAELYDYFLNAPAVGGLRRGHWAEIHSIISDARDLGPDEIEALKTIGVFNLVAGIGPLRASHDLVLRALATSPSDTEERHRWSAVLQRLQDQRIVTYRAQVDEYRIWQGSDFDVEQAIRDRILGDTRTLGVLLGELAPLGPVIAQRHSYRTGTLRYFERQYLDDLNALHNVQSEMTGSDGVLAYCLDHPMASAIPESTADGKPLAVVRLVVTPALTAAAVELNALLEIDRSEPVLQADSVARREVRQRIVAARERLDEILHDAIGFPNVHEQWFGGEAPSVANTGAALSEYCDRVFHQGPVLWNELINRRELTSQGARAQRELIAALLTKHDYPQLAIEGNGPELSMYDSLLRSSGIHREVDGAYMITPPDPVSGVLSIWQAIEHFCLQSTERPRPLSELYQLLEKPPYGARRGPIPVMLAAVLLYHSEDVSIYQDGSFLPVLGPAHFELLTKDPARFTVKHFALTGVRHEVFRELESLLRSTGAKRPGKARNATLLTVVRPLVSFASGLPSVTKNAENLTNAARAVRNSLLEVGEPDRLLFEALPCALGLAPFSVHEPEDGHRHELFRKLLFESLRELQLHYEQLLATCQEQLRAAFGMVADAGRIREDLRVRASYLIGKVIEPRLRSLVLAAVDEAASQDEWLESIVMIIADRPADTWSSDDIIAFEMNALAMARRFTNLEALQTLTVREGVEGFEARLVTVTEPSGESSHRLVWVDHHERGVIQRIATEIIADLQTRAISEHHQQAVLMTILEQLLGPPRPTAHMTIEPRSAEGRKHG